MSKILITGGAGFIGLHLAEYLLGRGCSVDLIDNFSRGKQDKQLKTLTNDKNVRLITVDILKPNSMDDLDSDYDYIYHLAAIIGVQNVVDRPYNVLRDNIMMLTAVIDFAKENENLKRLMFASTSEVYAGTLKHFTLPIPTPETTPLALTDLDYPRTSYMLSKIYGEALCHHSGLPFTNFRPHNIYGPRMGMAHVIPELLKKAYKTDGDFLPVFSVSHKRTFCYVDDAVSMLSIAAEDERCKNETINVGSLEGEISIEELAKEIISAVGKDLKIYPQQDTAGSPSRRCPDMTKTVQLTGYKAKISLEEGIRRTFEWYKPNVFEK